MTSNNLPWVRFRPPSPLSSCSCTPAPSSSSFSDWFSGWTRRRWQTRGRRQTLRACPFESTKIHKKKAVVAFDKDKNNSISGENLHTLRTPSMSWTRSSSLPISKRAKAIRKITSNPSARKQSMILYQRHQIASQKYLKCLAVFLLPAGQMNWQSRREKSEKPATGVQVGVNRLGLKVTVQVGDMLLK